jgi:hypothetical protein
MYLINHSCTTIIDIEYAAYIAIVEYGLNGVHCRHDRDN